MTNYRKISGEAKPYFISGSRQGEFAPKVLGFANNLEISANGAQNTEVNNNIFAQLYSPALTKTQYQFGKLSFLTMWCLRVHLNLR